MDETTSGYVPHMRRLFIRHAAARIYELRGQFASMAEIRAAVNDGYGVFGIEPLTDAEFSLLLAHIGRGALGATNLAGSNHAAGPCAKETTNEP